jgi:hypothetical protein
MIRLTLLLGTLLSHLLFAVPANARDCEGVAQPQQVAERLTDLPIEIRISLEEISQGAIAERDSPLLDTDAPGAGDFGKASARFARGYLQGELWIVFVEIALFRDARSFGFVRRDNGMYEYYPFLYLYGDQCAVRRAIADGVRSASSSIR